MYLGQVKGLVPVLGQRGSGGLQQCVDAVGQQWVRGAALLCC